MDNQQAYWDSVAAQKTFTHPLDLVRLENLLSAQSRMLDFGCGYGRIVQQLMDAGYRNVVGYDTSIGLISRGRKEHELPIYHINYPAQLPLADASVDCIILFAVLTCIPSNEGQKQLVDLLYAKLKPGGIIYISDYYLQRQSREVDRYSCLNDDPDNSGVFTLPEGATFRHHTQAWIKTLMKHFEVLFEKSIQVKTMNGHEAEGFQLIARK